MFFILKSTYYKILSTEWSWFCWRKKKKPLFHKHTYTCIALASCCCCNKLASIQLIKTTQSYAAAGWLSWLEHHPIQQKSTVSVPSQCTYLGRGVDPWLGHMQEATDGCFLHQYFSLSLFLYPLPFSLKSTNICLGENWKKKHVVSI